MSDATDPLEGADVGETETVTETRELWLGDLASDEARGSDRFADHRVSGVEVVTDEYGDEMLAVTVASETTKRLPRRWDYSKEPRTESEQTAARRRRWIGHGITAGVTAATFGIAVAVMDRVAESMAGDVTINSEPVVLPTGLDLVLLMLSVFVLAAIIIGGIRYLPRPGPGVGR
jgi:hypothetical protein